MISPDQPDTRPGPLSRHDLGKLPQGARLYRWDARTGDRLYFTKAPGGWVLDGTTAPLTFPALAAMAPVPAPSPLIRLRAGGWWEDFEARPAGGEAWSLHPVTPLTGLVNVPIRLERDSERRLVVRETGRRDGYRAESVPSWAWLPGEVPDTLEAMIEALAWELGRAHRESHPPGGDTTADHRIAWWWVQSEAPGRISELLAVLPWDAARSAYLAGLYGKPDPTDPDGREDSVERARRLVG